MNVFKSAFEKLSGNYLEKISENTRITAESVSVGGDLFSKVDEIVKYLKIIAREKTSAGLMDAALLKAIGGGTIKGIGQGFQLIVKALNDLPDAKSARKKMAVIVTGIQALSNVGGAILKFAASLALATPLLLIGITGVPLLALSIITIGGAFYLLDEMGVNEGVEDTSKGLAFAGLGIISIAGSLALFSLLFPPTLSSFTALTLAGMVIITIGGAFFVLDKFGVDKSIKDVSKALFFAGFAITALGGSLALFSFLFPPTPESFGSLILAGLSIVGIGIAMSFIGPFDSLIYDGSLAMIVASIPIILIAYGLGKFREAVPPTADGWETLGQVSAVVVGLGLAMAAAGAAVAFIVPGAGAMILAGGALIVVAEGIKSMSEAFTGNSIDKMLKDSGHETEGFLGFGGGRMMSRLEWLMLSIARSFTLPGKVLIAMAGAVPAMILAGAALVSIGKGVEKIQSLNIDYKAFPDQVKTLVTSIGDAFGEIGKKYPGGSGGIKRALLGSSTGDSAVSQGISAVMGMGKALSSIAAGVQNMANLAFPVEWDSEGNPVKFRQLTDDDFINLKNNTVMIVDSLSGTFGKIGSDPKLGRGGRKGLFNRIFGGGSQSPVADGISAVMGMGRAIGSIATGIQNMANLAFPIEWDDDGNPVKFRQLTDDDFTNLTINTQKIVNALVDTFGKIGRDPKLGLGGRKGLFNRIFGGGNQSPVADGLSAVMGIGDAISGIAGGVAAMASLKFPTGYDSEGKAKGYESIGDIDDIKSRLTDNMQKLVLALTDVFAQIGESPNVPSGKWWRGKNNVEKGISIIEDIGDPISKIATAAKNLSELDVDSGVVANKIKTLIESFTGGIGKLGSDGYADSIGSMWEDIGTGMEDVGDGMSDISSGINDMDLKKLTEARKMFESLALLSKNDPSTILASIGDNLKTAVDNLAILLSDFKNEVSQNSGASAGVVNALNNLKSMAITASAQSNQVNSQASVNFNSDEIVDAIEELQAVIVRQGSFIQQ